MDKIRIYLDLCCYNRPYDDQDFLSICLETQAKLKIQQDIKDGLLHLVWSTMIDYENSCNPDWVIAQEIFRWRERATVIIRQTEAVVKKAIHFKEFGVHNKDAIHLACALAGRALYFITTDKGILKKNSAIQDIIIINPIDFIRIMED